MAISLDTSIQYLTGVGPKRAALYQKLDIHTVRDLLYYFPRSYIDLTAPCDIAAMPLFEQCAVRARVVAKSAPQYIRRGMTLFRVKVADDSGSMVITFFNAKYAVEALKYDTEYIFYGRSGGTLTRREMASPSILSRRPAQRPDSGLPADPGAFLQDGRRQHLPGAAAAGRGAGRPHPRLYPAGVSPLPPAVCPAQHPPAHRPRERRDCPPEADLRGAFDAGAVAALGAGTTPTPRPPMSAEKPICSPFLTSCPSPSPGRSSGPSTRCGRTLPKTRR